MSHELRTPLNAIIGFSEIMESGMFGPLGSDKYVEYCRDIHRSGAYLLDVINDILDMSKIEAGRLKLDLEDVELDRDARRRDARGHARARRTSSSTSRPRSRPASALRGRPPRAQADRAQPPVQRGEIHARTAAASRCAAACRAARVIIGIEDTGIGIPTDALQKLGRPFEQVESQLTKSHHGSGLGLAIAKSLVELHGGAMRIRSTLGVGTTVAGAAAGRCRSCAGSHGAGSVLAPLAVKRDLRRLAQDPHEARAHARLRLGEMRFERGEIRHVGGARQQTAAARARPSSDRTARTGRAAGSASGCDRAAPPGAARRHPPPPARRAATPCRARARSTVSRISGFSAA